MISSSVEKSWRGVGEMDEVELKEVLAKMK
jgi:hypothetical protein